MSERNNSDGALDAYNAALMEKLKISRVASYDPHFDRIEGIQRFEP